MVLIQILILLYLIKAIGYFLILSLNFNKNLVHGIDFTENPQFDIIVPMYNEEKVIINTINSILEIEYDNFNVVVIDDGSTDVGLDLLHKNFKDNPKVKILHQSNKGKSAALNHAIMNSDGEFVICIDADTLVRPDLINRLLPYFDDINVAAVSGNIRVGNRGKFITELQELDYIINPNYERSIFENLNSIMVVPGAIGAFRRSIILGLGGYASDTLTEDSEITLRILLNGYVIKNAFDVVGYTEVPASAEMFLKQRVRWKLGTIQVLIKYFRRSLTHPNIALRCVVIPYTWLYGVLLPLLTPLIDYLFVWSMFTNRLISYGIMYLIFNLIDTLFCVIILKKNKKEIPNFFLLAFKRLCLRHLIWLTYFQIVPKFIRKDIYKWKKLTRYGTSEIVD